MGGNLNRGNAVEKVSFIHSLRSNKYPLIVTLIFFITVSFIALFYHHYWFEEDGIYFLNAGHDIINGNGWNIRLVDAPPGGPVLYAVLDSIFQHGMRIEQIISFLSGTGIVLTSYFIIRNVFNSKIALIGQLFFAFAPRFDIISMEAQNALLPILLIAISLYFVTKKSLKLSNLILAGILLGISFMIRYQALPVLIALIIFLLIHNKKIRSNLMSCVVMGIFFLIAASPMIIYNYITFGDFIDSQPNIQPILYYQIQTTEWHNKMGELTVKEAPFAVFHDFSLFLKNYFYDLFYNNPNRLFNFGTTDNASIIPPIPFLGAIPILGGFIYYLRNSLDKKNLYLLAGTGLLMTFLVLSIGDIKTHFFAIIIVPLLVWGIRNIGKIEKNFLPLLVLPVVYFSFMSIIPLGAPEHLYPMWFSIQTLGALFFIEVIPKIYCKIRKISSPSEPMNLSIKIISISLISLVLLANLGFSFKMFEDVIYNGTYTGVKNEIFTLFYKQKQLEERGLQYKQIGDILAKQPDIENSYVMANSICYTYYANSKYVHSYFVEGMENDTIAHFITRENWSPFDIYLTNADSYPIDRHNLHHPIPNYLIYNKPILINWIYTHKTQTKDLMILSDPTNPEIPKYLEFLYQDNKTGTVVYKIDHKKLQEITDNKTKL